MAKPKKKAANKKPKGPYQLMAGQVRADRTNDINDANTQYIRAQQDLNTTHSEAGKYLEGLTGRTNTMYDQTGSDLAARHAALQAQLGTQAGLTRGGATAEQERLGLASVGTPGLDAESSLAQQVAALTGTNDQSNLNFGKNSFNEVAGLLLGGNTGSRNSALGQARNLHDDSVNDINRQAQDQLFQIQLKRAEDRKRRAEMQRQIQRSSGGGRSYSSGGGSSYSRTSTADKPFIAKNDATTSTKRQDQGRSIKGHNAALLSLLGGPLRPDAPRNSKPKKGSNNAFSDFGLYSLERSLGGK